MLDLSKLNKNQLKAVTADNGPVLVVAGAGTGKTRVLTTRIAYLIEEMGYDYEHILAITFTNKAANEMKSRIFQTLNNIYVPWIGTYHAVCLKILRQDIGYLNRDCHFNVVDEEDQLSLLREIYREGNIQQKDIKPKKALEVISIVKTEEVDLTKIVSIKDLHAIHLYKWDDLKYVRYIYKHYNERLLKSNLLDFDDLLILTKRILEKFEPVRKKWQEYFHYVLVDEFQDSNLVQFELLNLLVNPNTQNVFAVGDPDQTIYTWRGAYSDIFSDYLKTYSHVKTYVLDLNYRSTKNILNAANNLIKNNNGRLDKDLVTDNDEGVNNTLYMADNQYLEANFIVSEIIRLTKDKTYSYKDIVVLYRAKHMSRSIEQALIENNIPYYIYGDIRFYQRKEIKDLIAYLKVIANLNDEISLKRIVNVPTRNIGLTTINKINDIALGRKQTFTSLFWNSLTDESLSINTNGIAKFIELFHQLIEDAKKMKISELLDSVIKRTNYEDYLKSLDNSEDRIQNVQELKESIIEFETDDPLLLLDDYLAQVTLFTDKEESDKLRKDSVSLMTIHIAKGTEYPVVFICGLNDGIFPSLGINKNTDMDEERRIMYVAITRAQQKLYLTCASGFSPIGNTNLIPSRFIKELGEENYITQEPELLNISKADLDWYDSRASFNSEDNYEKVDRNFSVGDIVVHTTFGSGTIIGVDNDMVDIIFKAPFGKKTIMKNHKSLKRLKH